MGKPKGSRSFATVYNVRSRQQWILNVLREREVTVAQLAKAVNTTKPNIHTDLYEIRKGIRCDFQPNESMQRRHEGFTAFYRVCLLEDVDEKIRTASSKEEKASYYWATGMTISQFSEKYGFPNRVLNKHLRKLAKERKWHN